MKPVFQTTFGVPHGNCFGACVASVLELTEIPCPVDPAHPDEDFWYDEWLKWFRGHGFDWTCVSYDEANWGPWPKGLSIAHILLAPGIRHAIVMLDGVPVHDPMPGSPFLKLPPDEQKRFTIEGYTRLQSIGACSQ